MNNFQFYPNGPVEGWYANGPETAHMVPQVEYFHEGDLDISMDEPGWYHRLTAPGYLDCTDWTGPFKNAYRAVRDCLRIHDIDLDGNPPDEA